MSNESRPTTGPKALGSEALKVIVGGTNGDDSRQVDAQTAIALTAGAGDTPTAPGPVVSEGASGAQAEVSGVPDPQAEISDTEYRGTGGLKFQIQRF